MTITEDELLYEVDAHDRVVGSCKRGDAHRFGLRHRSVHILVFSERSEVFLQKRSMNKDVDPGRWDSSAAGHVDFGESYDECAMRELGEELGIMLAEPPERLFKLPASEATGWEFVQVYRLYYSGLFQLDASEIDEGRWFSPVEISAWQARSGMELTASFRTIWMAYWRLEATKPHSL